MHPVTDNGTVAPVLSLAGAEQVAFVAMPRADAVQVIVPFTVDPGALTVGRPETAALISAGSAETTKVAVSHCA